MFRVGDLIRYKPRYLSSSSKLIGVVMKAEQIAYHSGEIGVYYVVYWNTGEWCQFSDLLAWKFEAMH